MFDEFEKYISSLGNFPAEEIQLIRSFAEGRKLRRRQLLLKEGDVCRHKIFVVKGLLRVYRLLENGSEHVMRFTIENGWAIDHESYTYQTPSKYYIEAVEDAEVILWTRDNMNILFDAIPAFRQFSDEMKEKSYSESQQRILINISYTAEEKYVEFVSSYPEVFRRVPLHMVASYLGVSRETLSRIRHSQVRKERME